MSKGFAMALAAALLIMPCIGVVCAADQPAAESKQDGCTERNCKDGDCKGTTCKDSDCQCDDCKCAGGDSTNCKCTDCKCAEGGDSNCKCTACKCEKCENGECDLSNCSCNGCKEANCNCTGNACAADEACSDCDKSGCRGTAVAYAGGGKADCENGKCCRDGSCECSKTFALGYRWTSEEPSIFGVSGNSLFGSSAGVYTSAVSDAMWQQIAGDLAETKERGHCFCLDRPTSPQGAVFLILENPAGGDFAIAADCDPDTTVSSVLHGAALPHPVNFATAEIAVRRAASLLGNEDVAIEADESVLPVRWDNATGEPTACTDHALKPNDRICVKLAAAVAATPTAATAGYEAPTPTARPRSGARRQRGSDEENAAQIQYSIQIVEDRQGCLTEYETLRHGAPMMIAESKSLLPAMRMLHKHELIRQLSSPKVICTAGQTAELEIDSSETIERDGMRLEISGQEMGDGLMVQLAMHSGDEQRNFEVRSALLIEEGQTIVLNANRGAKRPEDAQAEEPAVYIVLTPEIVK